MEGEHQTNARASQAGGERVRDEAFDSLAVAAIANDASRKLRTIGLRPHHQEGIPESGWVLIDFGDVILHIFSPDQRAHYDLDSAWSAAPQVVHVQ